MTSYLQKFLPDLSTVTTDLRKLEETNLSWNWTEQHDKIFQEIKKIITNAPILKYFDERKEITI